MANTSSPSSLEAASTELALPSLGGRPPGAVTKIEAKPSGIGRHHFHYLRSLIEGLGPSSSWSRYMAFDGRRYEERLHTTRLNRLIETLLGTASARGVLGLAEIALHPERLTPSPAAAVPDQRGTADVDEVATVASLPTLEDWIEEQVGSTDLDRDFYSEREWLDLYQEEFGLNQPVQPMPATALPAPKISEDKKAAFSPTEQQKDSSPLPSTAIERLALKEQPSREVQLDSLNKLEMELVKIERLTDQCSLWLSDGLAASLMSAGVLTIEDLIGFINVNGNRWHRGVNRVGQVVATRLVEWLAPIAEQLGKPIKATALFPAGQLSAAREVSAARSGLPLVARRFGLVPLDRLDVPPELDGRHGEFRNHGTNVLGATNDIDAIFKWLARYEDSPKTLMSYGRVAERFYLFCVLRLRKPMSSVTEADLRAYREFLTRPDPAWVQPKKVSRTSPDWRPLAGPLTPSSQRHTFTVLAAMLAALVEAGYLRANPARGAVPRMALPPARLDRRRSFTEAQWSIVMRHVQEIELALTSSNGESKPWSKRLAYARRNRLVLELGSTTGLRLSELVTCRMKDLRQEWFDGQAVWMLDVEGKGKRERRVVIYDDVKQLVDQHHRDMEAAGTAFDSKAEQIQALRGPLPCSLGFEAADAQGMRPLIGALDKPPAQWKVGKDGRRELDRDGRAQADRFGALSRNALGETLRRLFDQVAERAAAAGDLTDADADLQTFKRASAHWLRHFFANSLAADNVLPAAMQKMLGHADLKTTSIYVNAEERLMVAEFTKVRRRT